MVRIAPLFAWSLAARAFAMTKLLSRELSQLTDLDSVAVEAKAEEIVTPIAETLAKALDEGAAEAKAFELATKALMRGLEKKS